MPLVDLDAIPQVALPFMNDDHREEARLLNELADALGAHGDGRATAQAVLQAFEALHAHTRDHFWREEEAMQRTGFPPFAIHKAEHDRVLAEMEEEGRSFREGGDAARLWAYVSEAIPAWLVGHIQTMDLMTSRFVAARGG
jgi:hemerythrin